MVIKNEKGVSVASIRSSHYGEFQNEELEIFCNENGRNTFSTPQTPRQNGVVEIKIDV